MLHNMKTNKDGFGIRVDDEIIRTTNNKNFLNYILSNSIAIDRARLIHVHFRLATFGLINDNNVHLWKIGGYYCSHNGVASGYGYNKDGNADSYEFFKSTEDKIAKEDIKGMSKALSEINGIVFLTREDGRRIIAGSSGKPMKIYLFKNNTIVLANQDIKFSNKAVIPVVKRYNILGFELKREDDKQVSANIPKLIAEGEQSDFISLIDLEEMKTVAKENVALRYNYSYYKKYWDGY